MNELPRVVYFQVETAESGGQYWCRLIVGAVYLTLGRQYAKLNLVARAAGLLVFVVHLHRGADVLHAQRARVRAALRDESRILQHKAEQHALFAKIGHQYFGFGFGIFG